MYDPYINHYRSTTTEEIAIVSPVQRTRFIFSLKLAKITFSVMLIFVLVIDHIYYYHKGIKGKRAQRVNHLISL